MTGFKPWITGAGSDRSDQCALVTKILSNGFSSNKVMDELQPLLLFIFGHINKNNNK